jgi:ADP-ribosylglycohydrolase
MDDRAQAMVLAAFAADALALGPHWIYDTAAIDAEFGRVEDLRDPLPTSFHKGKQRGQFTHYGDQSLVLLKTIAPAKKFDPAVFADAWKRLFDGYTGYRDHATKTTLENMSAGMTWDKAGSGSTDLGGASRIAPLGALYSHDADAFARFAGEQTMVTHNQPDVVAAAEFFARLAAAVAAGAPPLTAVDALRRTVEGGKIDGWIAQGLDSVGKDTRGVINQFGQQCSIGAAFPAVIHLIGSYPDDLKAALVENVMAGGDSAARGMLTGMVLGAHLGTAAIPTSWLSGMAAYSDISALLT